MQYTRNMITKEMLIEAKRAVDEAKNMIQLQVAINRYNRLLWQYDRNNEGK